MNKASQPLTGPPSAPPHPSAPLPAPSPGLSQSSFPPGQPPVVFATPPPQMNPPPQPRQPYYASRPTLPANPGRVQPSSAPRPIPPPHGAHPPTHMFQPSSQMMMIPQQPIGFPSSQGTYYISGQYRPQYVAPQQYQVAGSPGFFPGTSPAEYAGAYYPAQPQYTPPVATAPVIMNPAPQQPQPPPQQQPQAPPKRERKQIRIRDPNQGGRDITEEIMSGGRSASTPTPPQSAMSTEGGAITHTNGENVTAVAMASRPVERVKAVSPALPTPQPQEVPIPPGENPLLEAPPSPPLSSPISDTVDAPPPAPADNPRISPVATETTAASKKEELKPEVTSPSEVVITTQLTRTNGLGLAMPLTDKKAELAQTTDLPISTPTVGEPLDSPIAQPEELQLYNGSAAPGVREQEAQKDSVRCDVSPIAEPDVTKEAPPVTEETPAPSVKETPAPVVKETPAPVVKETPPPVVKEAPAPVVKEAPAPVVKETPAPVFKEAPAPVVKETPAPAVKEAPAPAVKEAPAPAVKEAPAPAVKETSAPAVKETSAPAVKETSAPAVKETPVPVLKETPTPVVKDTPSPVVKGTSAPSDAVVTDAVKATPPPTEEREDTPPPQTPAPESTMQAVSVPKKKRKLKELNKKEAVGDLLDAFKEPVPTPPEPEATPPVKTEPEEPQPAAPPPVEEVDETWEDKLDAENIQPQSPQPTTPTEQKYQYKEEQWKPLNPEAKKKYDREFLLGFQFISASMHKPEGLPHISDVVLDKANKTPLRQLDPSRLPGMNCGPDFTPSFANLGRQSIGGRGPPAGMGGPRRSGQGQRKEPRKILPTVSLSDDVQLNKSENAWKPSARQGRAGEEDDAEAAKTQELFKRVRSVLNKLTPQMFQPLMKQVTELTIDTEERLKGVIDLIFEKAISEPNFSVAYANMCRCLMGLKVPTADKPGATVNFRKLLLNRCQKEFEKDKDDDETFEKKQKELDAASGEEERQRLMEELEEAKDKARRRSLGNIKFIGELFKLKMLTEPIMHDCIVKLLKNHDEESLECLCRLLSTIGKDLDFEKAKPRMDQYFNQMEKIIKERKTSSRIRFMLQDVLDLRRNNWVPRRGDQGPKTIEQIHKEAELEEHREQIKVQQQLLSKKESRGGPGGGGGGGPGLRGGPHTPSPRGGGQGPDEGWNTVPISKNRPIDTTRLSKITKPGALDFNNQLLAPGGKGTWGSWGKGSSGGSGAKPSDSAQDSGRPSTLNRFSALQQPSSSASSSLTDSDRRVPHRSSSSRERGDRYDRRDDRMDRGGDRFDRRDDRDRGSDRLDRNRPAIGKRSFSREKEERSREREQRASDNVRRVSSMTEDREREREKERERERGSREGVTIKENVKRDTAPTPPPPSTKPALTEEELEKKSTAIIEEYLHINDLREALQCVSELNSSALLYVFVRIGIESTLERSAIARGHMGQLFHRLIKAGTLTTQQYYKGLLEVLEVAEDMAIDIPHIWLYLAELITPMLHEGGIPMGQLFREMSKPLVPLGKAGVLLVQILNLLCKEMTHKKVGALWREAGLNWKDFLTEDEDVNKFVSENGVEYTLGEECVKGGGKNVMSSEEISKHLDQLLQDKATDQRIFDWIEANLDEQQMASNAFIRALMTSVCQSAIIYENPYKVDTQQITQRAKLLQRYVKDEDKELQALYALQSLMVQMEQPPNLLRMFFDVLYDEDVIKEEGFYKWESSKDPAEQQGKGVALKSVTAFFTWLREAEDESDNS
ncbi:eukaryotic translation initiation factor 4 gamma 1 [Chanos chanos]|uniref:Eukaryotic translation initiation factor 4 gamma 1 n=1 Tax=Chanos chanos TaxID=29144 RepID=A0A6J2VSB3_CHACN|nr:eukaryotic translation initiation factor 4 gamma 1-like [Chanos chanos]